MNFQKFLAILVFVIFGLVVSILIAWPEEFSEKLLPILFVAAVVVYLFLSWYLGYFIGSQKPPIIMMIIGLSGLLIAFLSGLFLGSRGG